MRKLIVLTIFATIMVIACQNVYAHSGRTTVNNPYRIPGHFDRSAGIWHPHF